MGENRKGWVRRLPSFKTFTASILPILLTFFATPIFPSTPTPLVWLMEPWRRKWKAKGVDGPRGSKTALIRAGFLEYFIDWAFVGRGGGGGCSRGLGCEGKNIRKDWKWNEERNGRAFSPSFSFLSLFLFSFLFSPFSFLLLLSFLPFSSFSFGLRSLALVFEFKYQTGT